VVDPLTLKNLDVIKGPGPLAVTVRVGATRLIDNVVIQR
jgi:pantothenate synthetase